MDILEQAEAPSSKPVAGFTQAVLWSRQTPHPQMLASPTKKTVMSHD
jgi:hypothetical protein